MDAERFHACIGHSGNGFSPALRRWTARVVRRLGLPLILLAMGGSLQTQAAGPATADRTAQDAAQTPGNVEEPRMWMTIGERRFAITVADTDAARAFVAQLPLTLDMAELDGNEKHADLSQTLPTDANRPGTIHSGDLMLYGSNTVVVFYETFRSPYAYTRLGRVDDPSELSRALGRRSSRVLFSVQ